MDTPKTIFVAYFAVLKEERGVAEETLQTHAQNALELYQDLQAKHNLTLSPDSLKVAINDTFCSWESPIQTNDHIVFIPPVSGG